VNHNSPPNIEVGHGYAKEDYSFATGEKAAGHSVSATLVLASPYLSVKIGVGPRVESSARKITP